jgi:glycosyltransferase involved in cell wall biosynthesis
MKDNGTDQKTLAVCFGQFGPYHHARVAALQRAGREHGAGGMEHGVKVVPVQIASATATYEWKSEQGAGSRERGDGPGGVVSLPQAEDLRTLCEGVEEGASPLDVFLKARKLFREEKVDVAFLPSYSPARYFALFAAARSLGIRTVMMNESHAGTEQATGWKRWIKRQIVKQFDAALVGGEPHKRHFASLGIPADKIFTGYDAVDGEFFAQRADEIRAAQKRSQESGDRGQQEEQADEVRTLSSQRSQSRGSKEQDRPEAEHLSTLNSQPSTKQSVRSAYGLPERYFLSLGRMVEKKNLATLIAAYGRYCDEWRVTSDESARRAPVSLVFVGSGELEDTLRAQARVLGLRVIDRTNWKAGQSSHSRVFETAEGKLTRINTAESANRRWPQGKQPEANKSERLAADRTGGDASCRVTPAVGHCPIEQTDDSAAQRGAVYFYGFRQIEENPVFYALAEAFVLPSLKEEWGLVVNEAMACSVPVIVSRTAGCAEDLLPGSESWQRSVGSVQFGEEKTTDDRKPLTDDSLEERSNGFVFDPKSSDALSEALRRIADPLNPQRSTLNAAAMGRRSREIVERFSCENFARQALRAAEAAGARADPAPEN